MVLRVRIRRGNTILFCGEKIKREFLALTLASTGIISVTGDAGGGVAWHDSTPMPVPTTLVLLALGDVRMQVRRRKYEQCVAVCSSALVR
jgi:hypothetical protein